MDDLLFNHQGQHAIQHQYCKTWRCQLSLQCEVYSSHRPTAFSTYKKIHGGTKVKWWHICPVVQSFLFFVQHFLSHMQNRYPCLVYMFIFTSYDSIAGVWLCVIVAKCEDTYCSENYLKGHCNMVPRLHLWFTDAMCDPKQRTSRFCLQQKLYPV